jgi:Asp-tRNA(Asn)/Glu-tRNA(Gln) amidotransferase A subunit family amidase
MNALPPIADLDLRRATVCQLLHWLAIGRIQPQVLAESCQAAIDRINPQLNAFTGLSPGLLQEQARNAEHRRRDGVIG